MDEIILIKMVSQSPKVNLTMMVYVTFTLLLVSLFQTYILSYPNLTAFLRLFKVRWANKTSLQILETQSPAKYIF